MFFGLIGGKGDDGDDGEDEAAKAAAEAEARAEEEREKEEEAQREREERQAALEAMQAEARDTSGTTAEGYVSGVRDQTEDLTGVGPSRSRMDIGPIDVRPTLQPVAEDEITMGPAADPVEEAFGGFPVRPDSAGGPTVPADASARLAAMPPAAVPPGAPPDQGYGVATDSDPTYPGEWGPPPDQGYGMATDSDPVLPGVHNPNYLPSPPLRLDTSGPASAMGGTPAQGGQPPLDSQGAPLPPPAPLPGTRLPAMQQQADAMQPSAVQSDLQKPVGEAVDPMQAANDDVAQGQRRDRILRVLQGLLRAAGGGLAIGGALTGNDAMQFAGQGVGRGIGNVVGAFGGNADDAAQRRQGTMQQLQRDDRLNQQGVANKQNAGRLAAQAEDQAASRALRDRQIGLTERAADREDVLAPIRAAQMQAQSERLAAQFDEASRSTDMARRLDDPESDESANMRTYVRANRQALGDQFDSTDEQIETMSARELEGTYDAINRALGHRRGRRGGAGSGGGGGASAAQVPRSFAQRDALNFPGATPEETAQRWAGMDRVTQRAFISGTAGRDLEAEAGQAERAQVRGFRYTRGEPPTDADISKVRAGTVGYQSGVEALRTMRSAAEGMGIGESLAGAIGIDSENTTAYEQARADFMNSLRQIQGMGVMSEGEFARLQAQVPSDLRTLIAGPHRIDALANGMRRHYMASMTTFGYEPEGDLPGIGGGGSASAPAAAGPQRYTVTNAAGESREMTLSPEAAESARARGATVEAL